NVGSENAFTGQIPTIQIRIVLIQDDEPLANELFVVEGLAEPLSDTTAEDGCVAFDAPVTLREVALVLPARNLVHPVLIGDLDPETEESGVRARLAHLGCYGWFFELDDDLDPEEHRIALMKFQNKTGPDATGDCDDDTRKNLTDDHGV